MTPQNPYRPSGKLIRLTYILLLWMAMACVPHLANAQLLENRGKLKTIKKDKKTNSGFFNKSNTSPSGVAKFKQGKNEIPPKSPDKDKQFAGRKRRIPSTEQNAKSKSFTPVIRKLTSPPGDNRYTISDANKERASKFQPETLEYQGDDKRLTRKANKKYDRENSKTRSVTIIPVDKPDLGPSKDVRYKGFDKVPTKSSKQLYQKEISRQNSQLVIEVTKPKSGKDDNVSYRGFINGLTKTSQKNLYKELSKQNSQLVIKVPRPTMGKDKNVSYAGFDRGLTKKLDKHYYAELSRLQATLIIPVVKVKMEHRKTHKYRGEGRGFTKLGYALFHLDNSRAQSKFEGEVQVKRYVDRLDDFNKAAAQMAKYTGGFKTRKRNNKMHPSASYVYGRRANSYREKELFRQLNVYWVRMNKNKTQPDSVKDAPAKIKFDKKEKDIWNY